MFIFQVEKCGIYILREKKNSYIATSPDGIVTCECHG